MNLAGTTRCHTLRDEVLARITLEPRHRTLLRQAGQAAGAEWWQPGDHLDLVEIERAALRSALDVLDDYTRLAARSRWTS